jgi:large subunit ribosomal protein L24
MKIKKGDNVLIILGKYRGKKGKILKVIPKKEKILIEGVNLMKKSQKPKKTGEKGQIIELPAPLDVSNVKLICSKCGKAVRIGYSFRKEDISSKADHKIIENKKYRVCKKCKQEV